MAGQTVTEECIDCGHDFEVDTSPQDDRCWVCAELDDAARASVA